MILTIDVGLRNLALCIMSAHDKQDISTYKIHLWDTYNMLDSDDYTCASLKKNGNVCGKKCGFKYLSNGQQIHCCKTHFSKELMNGKQIDKKHIFKKRMVNEYLLQDIAKIVLTRIQSIFDTNIEIFSLVTHVLIELQPKVNRKAIFTCHILYGKLVELYKDTTTTIRFVRASQKLKSYTGPEIVCKLKGAYAQRKWLGVQYTKWFLETKFLQDQKEKWLPFVLSHKKADDICDTALMAINGLYGVPENQLKNKNGNKLQ
jgi:hypothetical protein